MEQFDIVVVGAGPAGLCFARALADTGLAVGIVERQPLAVLEKPAFDGREIALTHRSVRLLRELGVWGRIAAHEVSPLVDARVTNGGAPDGLLIGHDDGRAEALGWLVPNHAIRAAAYEAVADVASLRLAAGRAVKALQVDADAARVSLDDGSTWQARLVVAADSRFSEMRRAMGIAAWMHDFGRTMLVCRMAHERPHEHVASENFDYGQTVALLPLNGDMSSVVLTLPHQQMQPVLALDDEAFAAEIERRLRGRLGAMRTASTRHAYPLVGVYPRRFVATRFATVGDAAVGMHPVTAHGFNLGLRGMDLLATEIRGAQAAGTDIAEPARLARFERRLRRASLPLYLATGAIVGLFTDDRAPARLLRDAVLRIGNRVPPLRRAIAGTLTDAR